MRIGLVTKGSRGDIQPFIALAIGLKNNGHQVTIVTIGSSFKAGTPMVIVSIVADQPFNGKLIEKK